MKTLLIGVSLAAFSSVLSYIIWGIEKIHTLPTALGLLCIGFAIIMSGALLSGPEMLVNLATQSTEDRKQRHRHTGKALLLGLPSLLLAIALYAWL